MNHQEKKYAALAPLMAITGVFAHPVASTVLPLIVFFIFYWRKMELAQLIALRAADLAFTAQMFIVTVSLLLLGVIYLYPPAQLDTRQIFTLTTFILLIYVILSLLIGTVQAFRGKAFTYTLSLKIAERIYNAVSTKNNPLD
ncbi:hypothetical protein MNBD_GAMMA21-620 [hydrothermal vent metagenome]|uniref:DUF4870 domain-containing protein n=1 Tax=hydrothermal vent metagenome TaxID=652676 RepID=A0A3B1AE70_9ZZZZ